MQSASERRIMGDLNEVRGVLRYSHAEEDVVLRAHAQTLSDGTELCPDVFAHDVGRARGGRKQACQNRPTEEGMLALAASLNHLYSALH